MNITRLPSRIEAVTVYRQGALVRRIATVPNTESGYPEFLCLTGLPLSLSDASVRVRIRSRDQTSEHALPVASDVRVTLDVPSDDDKPPPVADELEDARRALRRWNGRISQVKRELARVERLVISGRPNLTASVDGASLTPPPVSPTTARLALLKLREAHERTLREQLAAFEREERDAERHARVLEAAHKRASTARQADEHELRKALVIALHPSGDKTGDADGGTASIDVELVIEYLVPGARWAPAYSVRMAPDGRASFAMRAVVAQKTGENWDAIQLTLSTADAHSWTELPEMSSIRIGRRQPSAAKTGWRPPPTGVEQLFSDYDREFHVGIGNRRSKLSDQQWEDHTRELTVPGAARPDTMDDFAYDGRVIAPSHSLLNEDADELTEPAMRPPPAPRMAMRPGPPIAGGMPGMSMPPPASAPPARARRSAPKKKAKGAKADMAMPMPAPAAAPPSAQLFGGLARGAGGGGMHPGVYPEARAEMAAGVLDRTIETTMTADTDLLAYADLRMPPPHANERGSLRKADPKDTYMELLVSQSVQVSFNVLVAVTNATQRARAVADQPLPPRCRLAGNDRYDYAYRADTHTDVPSDGAFHSIALTVKSADTEMRYVVVPRESTDVFRTSVLPNPLGAPILDGPMDVYLGEDFLLTSDVPFTPPGGTIELGLGVEQSIKVTRNTAYSEETSGLLRGSLLLMHEVKIELQNHLNRAVECEVRERIPSTRKDEDDIEVKVEKVVPAWTAYQPELASSPEANLKGGHCWQVRVDGNGGKKALSAQYSVKIPSKYELVGGNRREA